MEYQYSKKQGFTLAEVLITLGVIGIVAALTLPVLVAKYKFKTYEVAFKKQYSAFQDTINYAVLTQGLTSCYMYFPSGDTSYKSEVDDCNALKDTLVSSLGLTKIKTGVDYSYTKKEDVLAQGGRTVNVACSYDYYASSQSERYSTKDGAIVGMNFLPIMVFDINGLKGPNKWGYDVFFLMLSKHRDYLSSDPHIFLTDEFCSIVEKGGRLPRNILRNKSVDEDSDYSRFWF